MGAEVIDAATIEEFEAALRRSRASTRTTVVQVHADLLTPAPTSDAWWDVPVAEISALASTRTARVTYERHKQNQRIYLRTGQKVKS
jgi:3D-(3,5/4)-trihydroxycyclohexane-1,2-dione acylhydrolase (decyclizing)